MERVSLEKKFDINDRCKLKYTTSNPEYEEVNIGSQEDPRSIKIGKILDPQERKEVIGFGLRIHGFVPLVIQ